MNLEILPVKRLVPNPDNPRTINEKNPAFIELVESVRKLGVLQPVQVRIHPKRKDKYELLAGHRRHQAALRAKCREIPTINYGDLDDEAAFRIAFIENAHREGLTPLEQGQASATALAKCKGDAKAAGEMLGETARWVLKRATVHANLIDAWRNRMAAGELPDWTAGHLATIARFPANVQETFSKKAAGPQWPWSQCQKFSITELEKYAGEELMLLSKAPFDTSADSKCAKCPKRTSCQPLLWDEPKTIVGSVKATVSIKPGDRCLDKKCWAKREASACKRLVAAKKAKYEGLLCVSNVAYYNEDHAGLKKCYGDFLSQGDFTICKKTDKGATPALVIAGKDKGKVRYVKVQQTKPLTAQKPRKASAKELEAQAEQQRWDVVAERFTEHLCELDYSKLPGNKAIVVALVASFYGAESHSGCAAGAEYRLSLEKASKAGPANVLDTVLEQLWANVQRSLEYNGPGGGEADRENMGIIAVALKLDLKPWCDEAVAGQKAEAEQIAKAHSKGKGKGQAA